MTQRNMRRQTFQARHISGTEVNHEVGHTKLVFMYLDCKKSYLENNTIILVGKLK